MKFATEHESPSGVRDRRGKNSTIKRTNERKSHSGLKTLNIYQFSWKVEHKYSDSNNQN